MSRYHRENPEAESHGNHFEGARFTGKIRQDSEGDRLRAVIRAVDANGFATLEGDETVEQLREAVSLITRAALDAPEGAVLHESTSQPGLYFWADEVQINRPDAVPCYNVVSQVAGYPATEAFDDWLANKADADQIAAKLAEGTL